MIKGTTGVLAGIVLAVLLGAEMSGKQSIGPSPTFTSITSTAASGANGFACTINGCRVDLGTGASDYLYSDGTRVNSAGDLMAVLSMYATGFYSKANGNTAIVGGRATDGATAVGVTINNLNALSTNGAKILSIQNNSVEKAYISKDGVGWFGGAVSSGSGFYASGAVPITMNGQSADGSTAVGVILNNAVTLGTTGAKLVSIRNNGSEVAWVNYVGTASFSGSVTAGSWIVGPALALSNQTLGTCNSVAEGIVQRQTGTGGTNTGARTRLCFCTSDGAASPTWAWQNLATGTIGTSTTCSP